MLYLLASLVCYNLDMPPIRKFWPLVVLPLTVAGAFCAKSYMETPTVAADGYDPTRDRDQNFSQVDTHLFVGARTAAPPADTAAVLCLTFNKDDYTVPFHQYSSIPDGLPKPTVAWLKEQVAFIDGHQKANRTTYVHCDAGVSRSATVTTAYLMFKNNWTRDQSLAHLKQKRPQVNPNRYFRELLLEWEKELRSPGSESGL
jgi:hypothetical protein